MMIDLLVVLPACLALNLAMGPNNLLALNSSYQIGVRFAVTAGLARLMVFAPMIIISACGLGVVLSGSAVLFMIIKTGGAVYLVWLGLGMLRRSFQTSDRGGPIQAGGLLSAFRREGLVAIGNPKAILIFTAFFPQFVDVHNFVRSYAVMGVSFLMMEALAISFYAALGRIASSLAASKLHWINRISGCAMIGFGCALLYSENPAPGT